MPLRSIPGIAVSDQGSTGWIRRRLTASISPPSTSITTATRSNELLSDPVKAMEPGADATAPDGFDLPAVTDSTAVAATVVEVTVEVTVVVPVADVMVIGRDTVTCDVAPTSTMWCRPSAVSAGMVTVPATAPDELAVRVARSTGVECSSTLTDSPGANPAPVTVTG